MTFASVAACYLGVQSQIDASNSVTVSLADFAINYVPIYLDKREAGLEVIQNDVQQYLMASLDFEDENAPAVAAQWNEQKSVDSSVMDTGTNAIDDMIENAKSEAQANETDMQNAIAAEEPVNEWLKGLISFIARGFN